MKYKINKILINAKDIQDALTIYDELTNNEFQYLIDEEKKAINDYKKAIEMTNDENAIYVLSHILKEETHHLELLINLQKGKVEYAD